eukprot:jgi/Psemu1/18316/gm1.18316_g
MMRGECAMRSGSGDSTDRWLFQFRVLFQFRPDKDLTGVGVNVNESASASATVCNDNTVERVEAMDNEAITNRFIHGLPPPASVGPISWNTVRHGAVGIFVIVVVVLKLKEVGLRVTTQNSEGSINHPKI